MGLPSPSFETSALQKFRLKWAKLKIKLTVTGQGQDKPIPKKWIASDNIDFQTSVVLHWATNIEVICPYLATPMLDSKLAALINTCVEHSHVTSVNLQVNYMNSMSLKILDTVGQATPICYICGADWAAVVCLVHAMSSNCRHSLHRAHWDYFHWGGSWLACGCSLFLPPSNAAEEQEILEVLRVQISESVLAVLKSAAQPGVNAVLPSRPNELALLA